MDKEMNSLLKDSRNCFKECVKHKGLIIVAGIIGVLLGFIASMDMQTDTYKATSTICSSAYGDYEQSKTTISAMIGYAGLIKSSAVCNRAKMMLNDKDLSVDDIIDMISVDSGDLLILKVSIVSESKNEAINVANAVSQAFVIELSNILGQDVVKVLDQANDAKIERNGVLTQWLIRLLCGIAGAIIMAAVLMIRRLVSKKIIYLEDFTTNNEVELLGVIPVFEQEKNKFGAV